MVGLSETGGEKNKVFDDAKIKLIKSYVEDNFDMDDFAASFPSKGAEKARKTGKKAVKEKKSDSEKIKTTEPPIVEETADGAEISILAGITAEERKALEQPVIFEGKKKAKLKDRILVFLLAAVILTLSCVVFYQVYLLVQYHFF